MKDPEFRKEIRAQLSANQRKWVQHSIIEGMQLKEIATQEGVSIDAVKSWGREARRKLRDRVEEEKLRL